MHPQNIHDYDIGESPQPTYKQTLNIGLFRQHKNNTLHLLDHLYAVSLNLHRQNDDDACTRTLSFV